MTESGHVTFDDRGQAVWEWSKPRGRFQTATTSTRLKKLTNVELSIVDAEPSPAERVRENPGGARKGYDPYDSGRLSRNGSKRFAKKDLRKLGEWIRLKKQVEDKGEE